MKIESHWQPSSHSASCQNQSSFTPTTLEAALFKHKEFVAWGISITRNPREADVVIKVSRKKFTTRFVYSIIEIQTRHVLGSGMVNSIGGTVEGKIADNFIKLIKPYRGQQMTP